jgi:proteasome lid subunit RPN8/RPN11
LKRRWGGGRGWFAGFSLLGQLAGGFKRLSALNQALLGEPVPPAELADGKAKAAAPSYQKLQRVRLTDGVGRTLFEEYASHRRSSRGEEETGWVLLGLREMDESVVLATLPAGAERSAGVAHVHFNSDGQVLASRIVRQQDRRLTILGVVHTHPGSLRHPSDGDYRGDSQWVGQLRGGEGVFGIGTADCKPLPGTAVAFQPKPHMQRWGELCLSWYSLAEGDERYRPVPVEVTFGPDLARDLHEVWPIVEAYAVQLERLYRQQSRVRCDVVDGKDGPALAVTIGLAEPGHALRVLLEGKEAHYFLVRSGEVLAAQPHAACVDQGVYLLLAELATQA